MAVTKRTRFEVLRRDNHTCRYCGAHAPDVVLHVDHVIPVALGGTDEPSNLVAACKDCNLGKASVPADATVVADVRSEDLRWAAAFARAAELRADADQPRREYVLRFNTKWCVWKTGQGDTLPRDADWRRSVEKWHDLGVSIHELERLVDVAAGNDRVTAAKVWRYFCGCVWRYVDDVRKDAAGLLAKEDADGA